MGLIKIETHIFGFRPNDLPVNFASIITQRSPILSRMIRQGDNQTELHNLITQRQLPKIERAKFPLAISNEITIPMIRIPGGTFSMGSWDHGNEQPIRQVQISEFAIGKYPVTNEEWRAYLEAKGEIIPTLVADPSKSRHPVVNVNWFDGEKYCQWLKEITGRNFRLPAEAEWEYAARGPQNLIYPWGNEWDPAKVVFNTRGTEPVDSHPEGAGPFGVRHMSGNVWEWVNDWYTDRYNTEDLVNPKGSETGTFRVLRGGSWYNYFNSDYLRSAFRNNDRSQPESRYSTFGFRVAEDLK